MKTSLLLLLLLPLVLPSQTVIRFAGTPVGAYGEQFSTYCTSSMSRECQAILLQLCSNLQYKINTYTIKCQMQCKPSVQDNASGIDVLLNFTDPTVLETSIDLMCSVFPPLLKIMLTDSQKVYEPRLQNVIFIVPKLKTFEWIEETVQFQVMGGLLNNKLPITPHQLDADLMSRAEKCLETLVLPNRLTSPLYPNGNKTLIEIRYVKEEFVKVMFTIEYPSAYLQAAGLDPTCKTFETLLAYALSNDNRNCQVTFGPNVTVNLISNVTLKTTPAMVTTTSTVNTGPTTGTGNNLVNLSCVTWIGLIMAHFAKAI